MRGYVRRLLEARYRVVAVTNGEEALHAARADRPDLVLSDVMMPVLDGAGLVQQLRADTSLRTLPVFLLSARAMRVMILDDDEAIRESVTEFLEIEGHTTVGAINGADALAQLDTMADAPDVICRHT